MSFPNTGCNVIPTASTEEPKTLYTASPWIRRNTQKDIRYMYDTLAFSGMSMDWQKKEKINLELTRTQPPETMTPDGVPNPEATNICES